MIHKKHRKLTFTNLNIAFSEASEINVETLEFTRCAIYDSSINPKYTGATLKSDNLNINDLIAEYKAFIIQKDYGTEFGINKYFEPSVDSFGSIRITSSLTINFVNDLTTALPLKDLQTVENQKEDQNMFSIQINSQIIF